MLSVLISHLTGIALFSDRTFRGGAAFGLSALMVLLLMPRWIAYLRAADATSDFGGNRPPVMGGVLLVAAVLVSGLIFSQFNIYSAATLIILLTYTGVGLSDDLAKVRNKRLVAAGKLSRADYQAKADGISAQLRLSLYIGFSLIVSIVAYYLIPSLTSQISIPFVKPEIWFPQLPAWIFIGLMALVITSTANGANFTDGLDSLVSVPLITTSLFAGIVSYLSANAIFAEYLLIPHLPGADELFPISMGIVGALAGYLWYNSPPAEIYMGDAGSIGLGGAVGIMFVLLKIELFLPLVGLVLVWELLSVAMQISVFKFTRRFSADKTGKRVFLRAPFHHHLQLSWQGRYDSPQAVNSKIIWRFHLVSVFMLAIGLLIFFKLR